MDINFISDLHTLSKVGLADPRDKSLPTMDVFAPVRERIFERWCEAAEGPHGKPDALVIDGDLVEGQNPKGGGSFVMDTDLLKQADHAVKLIKMWRAKKIYIVRGSDYHVMAGRTGLQVEEYLARQLKAEIYPHQEHVDEAERERSGWHLYLTVDGVTFHVSHKIGLSKVFHYQSTPTAREMLYAKLNDMLRRQMGKYKVKVVVRGHAHYFNAVEYSGSTGMVLPCWKGIDEFAAKQGAISLSPDLGHVRFNVEGSEYAWKKNLFSVEEVQPPPHIIMDMIKEEKKSGRRKKRTRKG